MKEQILKVTKHEGMPWSYINETGETSFEKWPSDNEKIAMSDDTTMYAVFQHGEIFSTRITPKREW